MGAFKAPLTLPSWKLLANRSRLAGAARELLKWILRFGSYLIRTLAFGWLIDAANLLKKSWALLKEFYAKRDLPHPDKEISVGCITTNHPSVHRPDPCIYSQSFLLQQGLPVTWDNPDIVLRRGGVVVPEGQLQPGTQYDVEITIWNNSYDAPVSGLRVDVSFLSFGVGATSTPIGTAFVDVGVKGSVHHPARVSVPWTNSATPGHYCIQAALSWVDDANPNNNLGQNNVDVAAAASPAQFAFPLRNPFGRTSRFVFTVDTYRLPELDSLRGYAPPEGDASGANPAHRGEASHRHRDSTGMGCDDLARAGHARSRPRGHRASEHHAGASFRRRAAIQSQRLRRWRGRRRSYPSGHQELTRDTAMAFRKYTSCVQPGDYINLSFTAIGFRNIFIMLFTGVFAAFIVWAFVAGPGGLLVAIALVASAVLYLHWWLNGRLICLNKEPCLIGMVRGLSAADPAPWGKMGDDDFSMNVMLAPAPSAFRTDFANDNLPVPPVSDYQGALQGELVSPQPSILAIGRTYVSDEDHLKYMTGLHCEFEGSGIHNLLIWAGIVLALLIAALAVQLAFPGLGWLVTLLILLAIFFGGTGLLTGPFAGPLASGAGHPTDVDEDLKTLTKGDIVVVKGEWIYDLLHIGWNEIHPIKDCCIIAKKADTGMTVGGPWPDGFKTDADVEAMLKRWCPLLDDAHDCEDGGSRDNPAHGWILHPLVDGCREVIIT